MISKTEQLQLAAASGNGRAAYFGDLFNLTGYVRSVGAVASGSVQFEHSDSPGSASWIAIGAAVNVVAGDGGVAALTFPLACYAWVRARIISVAGGTLSVSVVGNT